MGGRGAGGGGKGGGGGGGEGETRALSSLDSIEVSDEKWSKDTVDNYKQKIKRKEKIMPILVDKNNPSHVVDGAHRATAYKALGYKRVPVFKVNRVKFLTDAAKNGELKALQMQGWK